MPAILASLGNNTAPHDNDANAKYHEDVGRRVDADEILEWLSGHPHAAATHAFSLLAFRIRLPINKFTLAPHLISEVLHALHSHAVSVQCVWTCYLPPAVLILSQRLPVISALHFSAFRYAPRL